MPRDGQRQRVYDWDNRTIAPRDRSCIPFAAARGIVDAVWTEAGLRFPPRVELLPSSTRYRIGDADRLTIRLSPSTPSWCLLHELAHAMTTTHDGSSDGHGPAFMGLYVGLLARYLRLDASELQQDLSAADIRIDGTAIPVFVTA